MIEVLKQALEALIQARKLRFALWRHGCDCRDEHTCNPLQDEYAKQFNDSIIKLEQAIAELESQEPEAAPVAKNEGGKITWMIDDWPQNCLLYTHPPKSFTYEQVKAHIRAASMSANDIVVGSDVTNDGVSVVIRRRDEILYAEFFAHPPQRKPLTDEERFQLRCQWNPEIHGAMHDYIIQQTEAAHGIKENT